MSVLSMHSVDDMRDWMLAQFARGVVPPFSFVYGGKPSAQLLPHWQFTHKTRQIDRFRDYPTIEWVLRFVNQGAQHTPILSDVRAIDTVLVGESGWKLHRALGSNAQRNDFAPVVDDLQRVKAVHLTPVGGLLLAG